MLELRLKAFVLSVVHVRLAVARSMLDALGVAVDVIQEAMDRWVQGSSEMTSLGDNKIRIKRRVQTPVLRIVPKPESLEVVARAVG
jgi:hypothetical protein